MKTAYDPSLIKKHVPFEESCDEVRIEYLRPGQLLSRQEHFPVAFQPLGTIEWHGRHNPLGCDSIKAERLCIEAAKQAGGVVMPTIHFAADAYWDCGKGIGLGMDATAGFPLPGSFYQVELSLLKHWLINACHNYLQRGFILVVLVSGHNPPIQQNLMDEVCYLMRTKDDLERVISTMEYAVMPQGNPRRRTDHAAAYETGMMLHLQKDCVNMAANQEQDIPGLGIGGQEPAEQADAEDGAICFQLQTQGLVDFVCSKLQLVIKR